MKPAGGAISIARVSFSNSCISLKCKNNYIINVNNDWHFRAVKINYSEMLSALHKHVHASTIYQKCHKSCRRGRVGHKERFICYFGVDPDHMGNLGEVLKRMLCVIWWGDHASPAEVCTPHCTSNNLPLSAGNNKHHESFFVRVLGDTLNVFIFGTSLFCCVIS